MLPDALGTTLSTNCVQTPSATALAGTVCGGGDARGGRQGRQEEGGDGSVPHLEERQGHSQVSGEGLSSKRGAAVHNSRCSTEGQKGLLLGGVHRQGGDREDGQDLEGLEVSSLQGWVQNFCVRLEAAGSGLTEKRGVQTITGGLGRGGSGGGGGATVVRPGSGAWRFPPPSLSPG